MSRSVLVFPLSTGAWTSSCQPRGIAIICIALLLALHAQPAEGGEISGLPSPLPPTLTFDSYLDLSNDFLGRGGSTDDYRTQQIKLSFAIAERWQVLIDHSILTLSTQSPGRIDELALSFGYALLDSQTAARRDRLIIGSGLRAASDFHGEQIQNGFHQLIGSDIENLPYTGTDELALSGWLVGETWRGCCRARTDGSNIGYWLRGASYVTTRGEWDTSLGAYLTLRNRWIDGWLGLRGEWREGYDDDRVRAATADAESRTGVVLGLRAGPVVLETHQQFDGESSFGHLGFVIPAGTAPRSTLQQSDLGLGFGIRMPDVLLQVESRFRLRVLPESGNWRSTLFADVRYGEPQYENRTDLFVDTWQLTVGLDRERQLSAKWAPAFYGRAGVGIRSERLSSIESRSETANVARAVALLGTGLRWRSACNDGNWQCAVVAGIEYALADAPEVMLDDEGFALLGNAFSVLLGFELTL